MLCSKTAKNKIIKAQKRASRLTESKSDSHHIHNNNIKYLLKEVYQSLNKNNPKFMWNIWEKKDTHHNLRNKNLVKIPKPKSETFGYRSLSTRGALLWNNLPTDIKESSNPLEFKNKLKKWDAKTICNCHLCRT